MDTDLLIKLLSIQSTVSEDAEINSFIENYLKSFNDVLIEKDSYGNIYATKGNGVNGYKCIVSHTDTVHSIEINRKIYRHGDILFSMAQNTNEKHYYEPKIKRTGTGGDDRTGIYIALKTIEKFDNIKSVFFRFEETGCRGSTASNMEFFKDCNFVVQCDRKGNSDFITHTNGVKIASFEFEKEMTPIIKEFGYSITRGVSTDVGALKINGLEVSAVNLSSGYYDAHTDLETVNIKDLQNCYNLVEKIFNEHGENKFTHILKKEPAVFVSKSTYSPIKLPFQNLKVLEDNFFTRAFGINKQIELDQESKSTIFVEIGNTGMFKLIEDSVYDIDKKCPSCGRENTIMYIGAFAEFYCTDSMCFKTVEDDKFFLNCVIKDNGLEFVYDRVNDVWLLKENSIWDDSLSTFVQI